MKIYQLMEILKGYSQNDEILVPCGDDALTDCFTVQAVRAGSNMDNLRHVGLLPQEGAWQKAGDKWVPQESSVASHIPIRVCCDCKKPVEYLLADGRCYACNMALLIRKSVSVMPVSVQVCCDCKKPVEYGLMEGRCGECYLAYKLENTRSGRPDPYAGTHGPIIDGMQPLDEHRPEPMNERRPEPLVLGLGVCRACHKQQGPLDAKGLCPWCIEQPWSCYQCNKTVESAYDLTEEDGFCKDCARGLKPLTEEQKAQMAEFIQEREKDMPKHPGLR